MSFIDCIKQNEIILMEGALGERLKREYGIDFDEQVAMAGLVYSEMGREALSQLWNGYMDIAKRFKLPFIATTPTRRANRERVGKSVYTESIIKDNVAFLRNIQESSDIEMYMGGLMGCKGDAYTGEGALPEEEAYAFHKWQADCFAKAGVDFLYAGIMPVLSEAAGMARAMAVSKVPYIISFTIQEDGRLIDGTTISDAIEYIDGHTERQPVCYMTNCVHPGIVYRALNQPWNQNDTVRKRFLGIQANTSSLSYAELDGADELKCSDPDEFALEMKRLRDISDIKIFGGCCGTDNRHMESVAKVIT
ncbi:MAG: homocysteine S-methyltransferase family protein [Eubacteriales bacterium]|nr:homocysteine S-methyltransferase family protein [Eubacteriales bacterium]